MSPQVKGREQSKLDIVDGLTLKENIPIRAFELMNGSEAEKTDFLVRTAKRLLRIPAISPASGGGGEGDRAAEIIKILGDLGYNNAQRLDVRDDKGVTRPNIYLKIGDKERTLWIVSHIDTVPVGDRKLWKYDPFDATVDGDRIYGRGSGDNGQGIFTSLLLLKYLRKEKMRYSLGLAFVSDEETGSRYGIRPLIEHNVFRKDDLILVPDSGDREGKMIEIAEKTVLWLRFIVEGKQGHGSRPDLSVNAFLEGSRLVVALEKSLNETYNARDDLFTPPFSTFVPTRHEENVPNVNTIPGTDVFYFDCRIMPRYDPDMVLDHISRVVRTFEAEHHVTVKVEIVQREDSSPIVFRDAEVINLLSEALLRKRGIKTELIGIGGQTFANHLRKEGLPAAVWSTADESTYHQANEFCQMSYILKDMDVLEYMLYGD